ncbi:MAG: hypothetical protein RLY20_2097, partial [Verrucomicrobiota bacterium]
MKAFTALALLFAAALAPAQTPSVQVFRHENVLGTSLELKIAASSELAASQAEAVALAEIDRVAKVISTYDASSEYSRWFKTQNEPVKIAPELREVLARYDIWQARTDGALNAGAEAVSRVWKNAERV